MKKGFTLIELLVYIAIMGFIIVVAGRVFSDATGMRVRTQNMTKATEVANATVQLLKEDFGRMGAKEWKESGTTGKFNVQEDVYVDLTGEDSSSFTLTRASTKDGKYDEIIFRTIDLLPNDDGELEEAAVREIRYSVNAATHELIRQCRTLEGTANTNCPSGSGTFGADAEPKVVIATNVEVFSLNPSIPGVPRATLTESINSAKANADLFKGFDGTNYKPFSFYKRPAGGDILSVNASGSQLPRVTLNGFTKTLKDEKKYAQVLFSEGNDAGCTLYNFIPGETYSVDFDMIYAVNTTIQDDFCYMCMFQPGEDHIALGLRKNDFSEIAANQNQRVPDFTVYPPAATTGADNNSRHQEFSIPVGLKDGEPDYTPVPACVSLTFAFYSEYAHRGKLEFSNFNIKRKKDAVYHFAKDADAYTYNPGVTTSTTIADKATVKAFELELQIRVREEIATARVVIPTPNNGVFVEERGGSI